MTTHKILFVIVFHLLADVSYGQTKASKDTSKNGSMLTVKEVGIVVYELAIPPYNKEGMFPSTRVEIRKNNTKPTFIKFHPGGTETNIRIIDSSHSRNYKNILDIPPTKQLDFGYNENGLLEISGLDKGTYFIIYMSCNVGGNYVLTLTN